MKIGIWIQNFENASSESGSVYTYNVEGSATLKPKKKFFKYLQILNQRIKIHMVSLFLYQKAEPRLKATWRSLQFITVP